MKLLFKQRLFSWLDSYDIFDESGHVIYMVKSELAWGHHLIICDANGQELGRVQQEVLTLLPKFELFEGGRLIGTLKKEFSFFIPRYNIDYNGWHAEGDVLEWAYDIVDGHGAHVANIDKDILHLTDTYVIDVDNPQDALHVLMFVLAIDAEKCSRG